MILKLFMLPNIYFKENEHEKPKKLILSSLLSIFIISILLCLLANFIEDKHLTIINFILQVIISYIFLVPFILLIGFAYNLLFLIFFSIFKVDLPILNSYAIYLNYLVINILAHSFIVLLFLYSNENKFIYIIFEILYYIYSTIWLHYGMKLYLKVSKKTNLITITVLLALYITLNIIGVFLIK